MKKKLSVGLIFALIVTMLSAVGLAWSLSRQYFEDVAQLQFDSGYYEDWNWTEKKAMVDILEKYGLIDGQTADTMTNEAAVDAYMIARYGIDGRADTIGLWSILETELGPISTWTLEQKAWYSDMQIKIGLLTRGSDDYICALPEKTDTQPEEAIALAKAAIIQAYGLADDGLSQHQIDIAFETHASDWERTQLHYSIHFQGEGLKLYSCYISRDGRIMDSTMDEGFLSPAEQAQEDIRFANENDQEAIDLFQQYASEHFQDGAYSFTYWPLEDKMAVTDLLRPVILENMAQNPDYADHTRIFWATHFYGLPDENAISQDEAISLAREQLVQAFALTDEQANVLDRVGLFYEITQTDHPLWKITLSVGEQRDKAAELGMVLSNRYRVVIDAYLGEVLEVHLIDSFENTPEHIALEN